MDEGSKKLFAYTLASFIGCLAAFIVAGMFVLVLSFGLVNALIEQAEDTAISELEALSITCSEDYTKKGIAVTLNGIAQYCSISKRPKIKEFEVDFNAVGAKRNE